MKRSKLFRKLASIAPDKLVYSLYYYERFHKFINWHNPVGFNEKEQWLKLNYRKTIQSICADKYRVRDYVEKKVGAAILNELYGVYTDAQSVDFDILPDSFVLRVNHGCGWNIIVPDKKKLNQYGARGSLERWMVTDYYKLSKEWHYRDIPRRIVAERFLSEPGGLKDYKIYCFNGKPTYILVIFGRGNGELSESIYDTDWNLQSFTRHHKLNPDPIPAPIKLEEMLDISRVLSEDFPFVRIDLFNPGGKVYFGEITFHPGNGVNEFNPPDMDIEWGNLLKLPQGKEIF